MKLIDKDALVAEIENLEKILKDACKPDPFGNIEECMTAAELQALDVVKETVDTLEVKEVDLEEDVDKILEENDWDYDKIDFYEFAKHFFELGLKVGKEI